MSVHAATSRAGVDVCLLEEEGSEIPECPHGPMLLFERFFKDGHPPRKFYACSACRDRKNCSFFQWKDESVSETRRNAHREIIQGSRPLKEQMSLTKELVQIFKKNKVFDGHCKWLFCHQCKVLVTGDTESHVGHDVVSGDKLEDLTKPTFILRPLENQKSEAQYLFSTKATQFIVNTIRKLGFKKVLCIGTPRIHEKIQLDSQGKTKQEKPLDSLLLDIDYRYGQFFHSSKFGWYNMFNHYFFNKPESENTFLEFLDTDKLVLVMDPPFGGLVEVLACTIKKIWRLWRQQASLRDAENQEMPTIFIFPYFMESQIKSSLQTLQMMDYKVDYDNHPHFKGKQARGSKRGSPARIFTNISPAAIKLPPDEGYKFCKPCQRYVSAENAHCAKCNDCTSKDGRRYVHCDECSACVKPGRVHCSQCKRCELPGHVCNRMSSSGCHICGEIGHKRKECPKRIRDSLNKKKGKSDCATSVGSKKRKKQSLREHKTKRQKKGSQNSKI